MKTTPSASSRDASSSSPGAPPGEPGLRERKRRALREQLVEIAGRRFTEHGYDATNMREIADEAGVAYQTLYNHFPNKAHLALAWLEALTAATSAEMGGIWSDLPDDPLEAVLACAHLFVDMVAGLDRTLWREVTAEYIHAPEDFTEMSEVMHLGARKRLEDLLFRFQAAGALRPDAEVETLTDVIYVLVDHTLLRFAAMAELTRTQALADLRRQLALVMKPALMPG